LVAHHVQLLGAHQAAQAARAEERVRAVLR
jgi:hypothetical protein